MMEQHIGFPEYLSDSNYLDDEYSHVRELNKLSQFINSDTIESLLFEFNRIKPESNTRIA